MKKNLNFKKERKKDIKDFKVSDQIVTENLRWGKTWKSRFVEEGGSPDFYFGHREFQKPVKTFTWRCRVGAGIQSQNKEEGSKLQK